MKPLLNTPADNTPNTQLTIDGLPRGALGKRAVEYSIDEHSGNAYTAWLAMGSTQTPSAEQIAQLHAAAKMRPVPRDITRTRRGQAQLRLVLPRQSVKLIEIPLTLIDTDGPTFFET